MIEDIEGLAKTFDSLTFDKDNLLTAINSLGTLLRNEKNRSNPLIISQIPKLLTKLSNSTDFEVNNEILRVLINFVANNNANRLVLSQKTIFTKTIEKLLSSNDYEARIQLLLGNLVNEEEDSKEISKVYSNLYDNGLFKVLFEHLIINNNLEFDVDYLEDNEIINITTTLFKLFGLSCNEKLSISKIIEFLTKFKLFITLEINEEVEEYLINLENLSYLLFIQTEFDTIDFSGKEFVSIFLEIFEKLSILQENLNNSENNDLFKQINRKVFAAFGNLSSNINYHYHAQDIKLSLEQLDNTKKNGYIISSSFLILSNSITSSQDRDLLFIRQPHLISKIFTNLQFKGLDFFQEPLFNQSLFHLLKLLFISKKPIDDTRIIDLEFQTNFKTLEKLILLNFDNLFFIKINLSLVLKFLQKFIYNFATYFKTFQFTNFREILLILSNSLLNSGKKSIKELNPEHKLLVLEIIQISINSILINKFHDEELLAELTKALFSDLSRTKPQDVTMEFQNKNNDNVDDQFKINQLSTRFITLTMLISDELSKNTLLSNIDSMVYDMETSVALLSSEKFTDGLKNNLKVFTVNFKSLLEKNNLSNEKFNKVYSSIIEELIDN